MPAGPSSPPALPPLPAAAPPPRGARALARARWAVLRSRGRVSAARGVVLGPGVSFEVTAGASVRLGASAAIGGKTRIQVHAGELRIGQRAVVGDRCVVELRTRSVIDDGARLADEVVLLDAQPVFDDAERPVREQGVVARPISIGRQAIIGARAFIGSGVSIGPEAEVSPLAVVDTDVPAGGRAHGRPQPPRPAAPHRATVPRPAGRRKRPRRPPATD